MGNTGTKGDLKEQAQRHCHAHSTATTPLGATSAPRTSCRDWGGFSSREKGRLCHPALPHPSTSPSLTAAARGAPWGAGHTHRAPVLSQEPGRQQAAPTAGALAVVPWPAGDRMGTWIWGFSGARGFAQNLPDSQNWTKGSHPLPLEN